MWVKKYQWFAALLLLNVVSIAYAESEETLSMEFLEFLGEFQTEDGEWIDPLNLLDMGQSEPVSQHERDDEDQANE
ncbi:hypothetical protein [Kaarinaea lacus]